MQVSQEKSAFAFLWKIKTSRGVWKHFSVPWKMKRRGRGSKILLLGALQILNPWNKPLFPFHSGSCEVEFGQRWHVGEGRGLEKVFQNTWLRGVKECLGKSLQGVRLSLLCDAEWREKIGHSSQQPVVCGSEWHWWWGYNEIRPMHVSSRGLPGDSLQLLLWGMARTPTTLQLVWGTWVWTKQLRITLKLQYSARDTIINSVLIFRNQASGDVSGWAIQKYKPLQNHCKSPGQALQNANCSSPFVTFPLNQKSWRFKLVAS